jgi:hypothetical protein
MPLNLTGALVNDMHGTHGGHGFSTDERDMRAAKGPL